MDYYCGREYDFAPTDELFSGYAVSNRFDVRKIFLKRVLQKVLPEKHYFK